MKLDDIRELIKLVDESTITEFEFEEEGAKVLLKKTTQVIAQPSAVPVSSAPVQASQAAPNAGSEAPAAPVEETTNLHKIVSPMVGTFYSASSPDAEAFVKPGSKVSNDTVVCIIEAMKLFNEIEADVKGVITEVLVENGQLVEYGQPLYLVKTE